MNDLQPPIGHQVRYVTKTPFGLFTLPAVVCGHEDSDKIRIQVYADNSGGTDWVTHAKFDPMKGAKTWHFPE